MMISIGLGFLFWAGFSMKYFWVRLFVLGGLFDEILFRLEGVGGYCYAGSVFGAR